MIKILMIDDDHEDYLHIRNLLNRASHQIYHVDWAEDIAKAETMLSFEDYDLFLVDHFLAGETGIEFMQGREERGDRTPSILLSGQKSITLAPETLQLISRQRVGFLAKTDLDLDLLTRVITEHAAHSLRVLVVDDDTEDFESIRGMLQDIGQYRFDVSWSPSFADAERQIWRNRFELFVIAYNCPGNEMLTEVRKVVQMALHQPVIMLSRSARLDLDDEFVRMIGRGNLGYLAKSRVSPDALANLITFALLRGGPREGPVPEV